MPAPSCRIAVVSHRDREAKPALPPDEGRFAPVFQAFGALGAAVEPALYHDECCDAVRRRLLQVDAVLVWVNPEEGGRDRTMLDTMLREVAGAGVFVSAHPDVIGRMGTKEVLYQTRTLGWGCDTHLYRSAADLRRELPGRLAAGSARVLKRNRGHGGDGVWRVELAAQGEAGLAAAGAAAAADLTVRLRHAKRGSTEEVIRLRELYSRMEPYFDAQGRMIDQAYQPRLPEGMIRCYLVQERVGGFGLQAINALHPPLPCAPAGEAPKPTPRLYHPPTLAQGQALRRKLESEWVPQMLDVLDLKPEDLPVLWDADFLLGPKTAAGEDSYVLCEVNASSVSPFPDVAAPLLARATLDRIRTARR